MVRRLQTTRIQVVFDHAKQVYWCADPRPGMFLVADADFDVLRSKLQAIFHQNFDQKLTVVLQLVAEPANPMPALLFRGG
jgi:hypothetical protein